VIDALGGVQSVLVLGGASELALATVAALPLRPGAVVVLAGRDAAALAVAGAGLAAGSLAAGSLAAAARVETLGWDAAAPDTATAMVTAAVELVGGDLDVVLAAAGVLGDQALAERDPAVAAEVLTVNLVGVGAACLAAAARLRVQGHGALVVYSSVAGLRARRENFVYGASKAGLDALGSGLVDALHGSGARVVLLRPGFVRGRMTEGMPAAPFATTPAVVGAAVAAALRSRREVVHVPAVLGPLFAVLRLTPRALWRRLSA